MTSPRHVLLTGATGFIGQAITTALQRSGHTVHPGLSPRQRQSGGIPMDFAADTQAAVWLPRLQGIDVVINAVGVLRDTAARPIDAVHHHTPVALFDACAQAGVRRVIQISALGVQELPTRYARTKRAADDHLQGLSAQPGCPFTSAILRPSVVFGYGGDSSALFMNLARLPVVTLPEPVLRARLQPVAVTDLADGIAALVGDQAQQQGILPCVGPEALTMAALIASLREQCGRGPAQVLRLPGWLTRLSARVGDWVPPSPWCSETLAMLACDNTGDPTPLRTLIGRDAVHYRQLVARNWLPLP